jgi:hypothetical protein
MNVFKIRRAVVSEMKRQQRIVDERSFEAKYARANEDDEIWRFYQLGKAHGAVGALEYIKSFIDEGDTWKPSH